ncbi:MAG: ABC transporter ATP-binding protein [Treponema sp.]
MLLEALNISKTFKRREEDFYAVKNVDFSLSKGEFVFICGRSGSGKTTLLNLLAGLLNADSGTVLYNDKNIFEFSDNDKSFYRNEYIGFVPQTIGSLPNLSVLDNVRLPHFLFKRDGDGKDRALFLLEMMGISGLKDELPKNLSGGETKRMLIARALMNSPTVLIADEPTSDLDASTTKDVMSALKSINSEGTAVIIVTHDNDILSSDIKTYTMSDGCLA